MSKERYVVDGAVSIDVAETHRQQPSANRHQPRGPGRRPRREPAGSVLGLQGGHRGQPWTSDTLVNSTVVPSLSAGSSACSPWRRKSGAPSSARSVYVPSAGTEKLFA